MNNSKNEVEKVKIKLKKLKKKDIIFSPHSILRASIRRIDTDEVINNLLNPEKLAFAFFERKHKNGDRYLCYFGYSKTLAHKYVIILNKKCIIVTAIKIKRKWQRRLEKRAKI